MGESSHKCTLEDVVLLRLNDELTHELSILPGLFPQSLLGVGVARGVALCLEEPPNVPSVCEWYLVDSSLLLNLFLDDGVQDQAVMHTVGLLLVSEWSPGPSHELIVQGPLELPYLVLEEVLG